MGSDSLVALASGTTVVDAMLPGIMLAALVAACLPWLDRNNTIVRTLAIGLCIVVMWRYLIWRAGYTMPPIDNPVEFAIGLLFVVVEALSLIGSTISLIWMTRIRSRSADADEAERRLAAGTELPLVDIFICTYNEDKDILLPTITGALDIDYANKRIWVLDDGRRDWLAALCAEADCGYITRQDNAHAKAGNINNALAYIGTLDVQPDYISILDADFVCQPAFLKRTVALMEREDVGVVQTPQHFSNADPIQRNLSTAHVWPDEQRFFFDVVMATKDAWGSAFCCGTSSLLRYEALEKIGGFPTDSVTEDYLVSLRLRERGYRTVYLNERLSVGLAPEGLKEYVTQRSRWCLGFVQICRGASGPLRLWNGVPLPDRIMLVETFLYWSATHAFRLLGIVVPALYLLFDIQAVHAGLYDAISYLLPFFLVQVLVIGWLTQWRVMPIMADVTQLLSAHEILKAVFAGLVKPKGQKFKVTAKGGDRSKRFVQWPMMRIFLGYLALTLAGIIWAFVINGSRPLADAAGMALFWSWYNAIVLTLACFVCIEEPRRDVRWSVDGDLDLYVGGLRLRRQAVDVSDGGVRISGPAPFPVGTALKIGLDETMIAGTIVRTADNHFAVQFAHRSDQIKLLLREHRTGPAGSLASRFRPSKVALAIAGRAFR